LELNKIKDHYNNLLEKHIVRITHYPIYSKLLFVILKKINEIIKKNYLNLLNSKMVNSNIITISILIKCF
jgi:hypothetical protein